MNGQPKYSREELKKFIKDFYNETGKIPRQKDFLHDRSRPSFKQFIDEWGSWSEMLIDIGLVSKKGRPVNKNEHICAYCGKVFHAYGDRKYCSLECKVEGQRKYEGGTSSSNPVAYRTIAFKNYDWKCCVCGYEEEKDLQYTKGPNEGLKFPVILDVHHLDSDRTNNEVDNLCIVCPTCHAKIHRGLIKIRRREPFKHIVVEYQEVFGGLQKPLNSMYGELQ